MSYYQYKDPRFSGSEEKLSERSRWTPLTRMLLSGSMTQERQKELTTRERFDRWMVNEGYRRMFVFVFAILHAMVFSFGFVNYAVKDSLQGARDIFGPTYMIARAAALVIHFDVAMVLFPVCRTFISLARQTPLNGIIQFDKNITFHITVAWSIFFFSWVHTIAHWNNLAQISAKNNLGIYGFLLANFTSGPGWSGYFMLIALTSMVLTSVEKPRRANYERFWYTHHMFIVFFMFWSVHGAFCMIQPDVAPFCISVGTQAIGVFWQYWMYGGFVYLAERVAREMRGRHKTYVSKVIQHPSMVCEIQIKKENTKTRAGQYIFFSCPEVSIWQYHPFTLTSAPEEDYISIHMRVVGDFTRGVSKALGCEWDKKAQGSNVVGVNSDNADVDPALRRVLPRVYVDGPFGSASEDVFKYEVSVLVGAGIGVTPFASILKSIWYRMNYPQSKTRLAKVYFFWVCRDFGSFEWFRSLLLAIEAQDVDQRIEIHTYLTARIKADDATNIMINDVNSDKDAITGLRAPTNFGRPNWDMIFRGIRKLHAPGEAGVFFCGPKGLGSALHIYCNKYSEPGFNYVWGKENF
ncbi:ferric reductase like transmembrane component [Coniella lustricola]|uniref:Ferric reductase like transmembrane component n=1 Tax=Coniella lustricola TaxID=2025994 RepID=A0A2T3A7P2_9PEZI|nr:ferric reductase like transmembrane component [Coniella lustricola]